MSLDSHSDWQLPDLLDELATGIIVADGTGRIEYANDAAGDLLGSDPGELDGHTVETALSEAGNGPSLSEIRDGQQLGPESGVSHTSLDGRNLALSLSPMTAGDRELFVLSLEPQTAVPDESERFRRRAFETTNDAFLVLHPEDGAIVECNERACSMLGYDRAELTSLTIQELDPQDGKELELLVEELLDSERTRTAELSCRTCDGDRVPVEVSASTATIDGDSYIMLSLRDVSVRTEYERRLEALTTTTSELITAESVQEVADAIIDIVQRIFDRPIAGVWTFDSDSDRLDPVSLSDSLRQIVGSGYDSRSFTIEDGTLEMSTFRAGEEQFVAEYGDVERPAHPELSLESRFLIPLGSHGLVGVGATESGQLTAAMQSLLCIIAGNAETALDRLESEQTERRRSAAVEAATDGIAILDGDAEFVYVNPAYATLFGYEDREKLLDESWETLLTDDSAERVGTEVISTVDAEGSWRGELVGTRRDRATVDLGVAVTRLEDGCYVNVCSDISHQKARERRLKKLNELNQSLMQAETWDDISSAGTDMLTECLPFDMAAIRLFDPDANTLEIKAMTDSAAALLESRPAYDLDATYAGTAYRRGQPVVRSADQDDPVRERSEYASLHVPLQEYGTLSVLAPIEQSVDDDIVEFVNLFGTALGMAYERVEREEALRERRNKLTWLNRVNTVVREIIQSLVGATTRNEIEAAICERLAESDLYEYAWVGEIDRDTEEIIVRASAGADADQPQSMAGLDLFKTGADTVLNAVRTGGVETVRQYRIADDDVGPTDDTALSDLNEFEMVAAIPLSYGSRVYGVLIIKTERSETFEREAREEFELLGETAGFVINAIQNRQVLLSNRITELRFEVTDSESLVVAISEKLDCSCKLEIAQPTDGGSVRCYLRLQGVSADDPAAAVQSLEQVDEAEVASQGGDECLLELVQSNALAEEITTTGASIQSAIGRKGMGEVVLEVPQSADVQEMVNQYQKLYPDSELVAKRERKRGEKSLGEFRETVEAELTDRQQAVLESAYEAGYFDWPRESTAEEIADELEISSSTLHQHLRMAEWKLLTALFESG